MSTVDKPSAGGSEEILRWRIHLARFQPKRYAFLVAVILLVMTSAYVWLGGPFPAFVVAFVLFGALSDFFLPITFTLTSTHASAGTLFGKRVIAWKDVKKVYLDSKGVKLSPLGRQSRLEAYRGVYLYFADNRQAVIDAVAMLRPKDV